MSPDLTDSCFHGILFDLDGTLLDTTRAIYLSFEHTIRHFTGISPTQKELSRHMGLPLKDQLAQLLPGKEEQALKIYEAHNLTNHKKYVQPYPNAVSTLHELKKHNVALALVTSKRQKSALVGLEIANIHHMFDVKVFCEDTVENKPHAAPVLKALELLGYIESLEHPKPIFPFRTLMVGDSPWDINSGKNAEILISKYSLGDRPQIKTAGVSYGAYAKHSIEAETPDYIFDDISQILDCCKSSN